MTRDARTLIHDWNSRKSRVVRRVEVDDETLRDGLQSPSVRHPSVAERVELLRRMARIGIDAAAIGMPVSGESAFDTVLGIAQAVRAESIPVRLLCAARTVRTDIEPIVEIADRVGSPIEVMAFIGSSPIRIHAEGWEVPDMLRWVRESVRFGVSHGLPVCLVTEDTTRAQPELLKELYTAALEEGATRICLADTVGHATPDSVVELVGFIRSEVLAGRPGVALDWHGHNDRGLALANTLAAIETGVTRVHGTALGIGERCGNTAIEQILMNARMLGDDRDLSELPDYCGYASQIFDRAISADRPLVGADAFHTATGVHAAAIIKAARSGEAAIADTVYATIDPTVFGLEHIIGIGPASGAANVRYRLDRLDLPHDPQTVEAVLQAARAAGQLLDESDLLAIATT
jgi:2-isopropylmalate synthase